MIWYSIKNTLQSEAAKFLRTTILNNIGSPEQYGLLVLYLINATTHLTKTSTWPFLPYQEIEKLLCEEHFEEFYFSKSVDIGRRLMNSKDKFMSNLAFDL